MIKPPLFAVLLMGCGYASAQQTDADASRWFPIVATRNSVAEALHSLLEMGQDQEKLALIATDDCRNLRPGLYLVVEEGHDSRAAAESLVAKWRKQGVGDAYLRNCNLAQPSRLSFGVPLLDASLMMQSIGAVNWDVQDAVSRVIELADGYVAAIIPRYEDHPDDIREGLRIGVHLYNTAENRSIVLSSDCIDPELALNVSHVALSCVTEIAASHLLHRTQLHSLGNGQVVAAEDSCTKPSFTEQRWLCYKESVDETGRLKLEAKTLHLP